jgi:hypothetical protein
MTESTHAETIQLAGHGKYYYSGKKKGSAKRIEQHKQKMFC